MSYAKPPVLRGSAKSDYENYLRTDELLSLQKNSDEWEHRDELLFTIVHQSSELWLKLTASEVEESIACLQKNNLREPTRLLSRAVLSLRQTYDALEVLERMSPWEYQQVRVALGHGSGFDSPGMNRLRKLIPRLGGEFQRLLTENRITLISLYMNERLYEDLFRLAEWLLEVDERVALWRMRHFFVVERTIGMEVSGTQGTPVEILAKLNQFRFFPELWKVRTEITTLTRSSEPDTSAESK